MNNDMSMYMPMTKNYNSSRSNMLMSGVNPRNNYLRVMPYDEDLKENFIDKIYVTTSTIAIIVIIIIILLILFFKR
jgi:heme/copper-type cytochrome/quinol oxidase subunit 2